MTRLAALELGLRCLDYQDSYIPSTINGRRWEQECSSQSVMPDLEVNPHNQSPWGLFGWDLQGRVHPPPRGTFQQITPGEIWICLS